MKSLIIGKKYGRLTVIEEISPRYCLCECECGNEKTVRRDHLLSGATKSCGCLLRETTRKINYKHGLSSTPDHRSRLYKTWDSMKQRCYNPNDKSYSRYGARGITICEAWLNDFVAFSEWAMANGYSDNLTIDRIDVNGNYEPSNCRWADSIIQANNKRNNTKITYNSVTHTLAEWSRLTGIEAGTISIRLRRGLPLEQVFFVGDLRQAK